MTHMSMTSCRSHPTMLEVRIWRLPLVLVLLLLCTSAVVKAHGPLEEGVTPQRCPREQTGYRCECLASEAATVATPPTITSAQQVLATNKFTTTAAIQVPQSYVEDAISVTTSCETAEGAASPCVTHARRVDTRIISPPGDCRQEILVSRPMHQLICRNVATRRVATPTGYLDLVACNVTWSYHSEQHLKETNTTNTTTTLMTASTPTTIVVAAHTTAAQPGPTAIGVMSVAMGSVSFLVLPSASSGVDTLEASTTHVLISKPGLAVKSVAVSDFDGDADVSVAQVEPDAASDAFLCKAGPCDLHGVQVKMQAPCSSAEEMDDHAVTVRVTFMCDTNAALGADVCDTLVARSQSFEFVSQLRAPSTGLSCAAPPLPAFALDLQLHPDDKAFLLAGDLPRRRWFAESYIDNDRKNIVSSTLVNIELFYVPPPPAGVSLNEACAVGGGVEHGSSLQLVDENGRVSSYARERLQLELSPHVGAGLRLLFSFLAGPLDIADILERTLDDNDRLRIQAAQRVVECVRATSQYSVFDARRRRRAGEEKLAGVVLDPATVVSGAMIELRQDVLLVQVRSEAPSSLLAEQLALRASVRNELQQQYLFMVARQVGVSAPAISVPVPLAVSVDKTIAVDMYMPLPSGETRASMALTLPVRCSWQLVNCGWSKRLQCVLYAPTGIAAPGCGSCSRGVCNQAQW